MTWRVAIPRDEPAIYARAVELRRRELLVPAAIAAAVFLVHLACGGRYGFFRDELYFVACGQRLAWGYVDQPPLIALIARFAWWLSGHGQSVLLFRLPAALSQAATVVVAAAIAGRLGGGPYARALAAAMTAVAPIQLAQGHLLTMNTFEILLWASVVLAVLVALRGARRAWIAAGALLGLALLDKYSAGFLAVALLVGLLATSARAELRSRWFWIGVALAAALALPSALWQLRHGLPFLELLRNGRLHKNAATPAPAFARELLVEQGPLGAVLAIWGLAWLFASRAAAAFRFLGITIAVLTVGMLALHAKPYYLAPAITPLFAAGAVALELAVARAWVRRGVLAVGVLSALPAMPLVIPLLPIDAMLRWQARLGIEPQHLERLRYNDVPQHFADQFGWPERVASVEQVIRALPTPERNDAVIYTGNYGRAAALQLFGHDLPPVICGHNQYFLWGVPGTPQIVIALGGARSDYAGDFAQVELAGRTPDVPDGMPYESAIPIYVLRGPRRPVAELFVSAKHFE